MQPSPTVLTRELEPINEVNRYDTLQWTNRSHEYGTFRIWCALDKGNAELLQQENLLWIGDEHLAVIEGRQKVKSPDGKTLLLVFGRHIESWIGRNIIWNPYSATTHTSTHMRNLVNQNVINPARTNRRLPFIMLDGNQPTLGINETVTTHRGALWEFLKTLGAVHNLMPRLLADIPNKQLRFTVLGATDRSIEQTARTPIILSSDLSDILESDYLSDYTDWRSMAFVDGQGEGAARRSALVNDHLIGLDRREHYIDARDVNQHMTINGSEVVLPDAQYLPMLRMRGHQHLQRFPQINGYECRIRTYGTRVYSYGVDYFIGDRITLQDHDLGIQISTEVTEAEQTWDETGHGIKLTVGRAAPTITQLAKRSLI